MGKKQDKPTNVRKKKPSKTVEIYKHKEAKETTKNMFNTVVFFRVLVPSHQ